MNNLNLMVALPELVLLVGLFAVLLADLWICDKERYVTHYVSIGTLAMALLSQLAVWTHQPIEAFHGLYVADGVSQFAKVVMYAGGMVLFVYSEPYNKIRGMFRGEYYTLTLFALAGMSVMVSAGHFLSAYLGLELLSLSLYAMIAFRRDNVHASEAALKYFVLGALASGLLLYGISMIYGAMGTLEFSEMAQMVASGQLEKGWLLRLGVLFVVVAIAFKFGAVPFHMWVPDVYQGSPTSVTVLIGSVPKIAATVFTFRILVAGVGTVVDGAWLQMFEILAVLSLLVGNLAAIAQTNIKRMFAFSTIAHMGFVLMAFLGHHIGVEAAIYYATTYVISSLAGFGVLILLNREGKECENISDLAGLNQRNPWCALVMLLVLFSMAGIPPLMGFYAKFSVLNAIVVQNHIALAVFAVVMSLIGAFYYLRVVKVMYFDEPSDVAVVADNYLLKVVLSVNALLLLIWGMFPDGVMSVVKSALTYA